MTYLYVKKAQKLKYLYIIIYLFTFTDRGQDYFRMVETEGCEWEYEPILLS